MDEQKFLELVKENFEEITANKADELLEDQSGKVVFIGRETCPFCRKFIQTLSSTAKENDLHVYFVHSQGEGMEEEIQVFRDKYEITTVPGLLYSDGDTPVRVRLDSSMTPEEILEFVNA